MSVISAYEKMLKNGSASRPIRIAQPTPDNQYGGMNGDMNNQNITAMGESKEDSSWDGFDAKMEEYIANKRKNKKTKTNESKLKDVSTIKALESRVALLEGVVEQIMKAQMDLLNNG